MQFCDKNSKQTHIQNYIFWVNFDYKSKLISRPNNYQMQKQNYLFLVLLCLAVLSSCGNLQTATTGSGSCCSLCSQSKNLVATANPKKIINQVFNLIETNSNDLNNLLNILKLLPLEYTQELAKNLINFAGLQSGGLAFCPSDVTQTGEAPYSTADAATVQSYLQTLQDLIAQSNASSNYKNTIKKLIDQTKQFFSDNPDYIRFALPIVASINLGQDISVGNSLIYNIETSKHCATSLILNYPYVNPFISFNTYNVHIQTGPQVEIPVTHLPKLGNLSYLSSVPKSLDVPNVCTFGVSLDRFVNEDVSIYSPDFLQVLGNIDFSAYIYNSDGTINANPQQGFAPGETVQSIWGRLVATIYGPYLHCKFRNLATTLSSACPATCMKGC